MTKINVQGTEVRLFSQRDDDYISLTDIARYKNKRTDDIIKNWLRNHYTIEFLGIWEQLHNPHFNPVEFDWFRNQAGSNSFVLTSKQWIEKTKAIGIISKSGRYGGTYAHKDIAFEFASWISPKFKLYLIKEFQRLKKQEDKKEQLGWDVKRILTKMNYKIHTNAIKNNLIPPKISKGHEKQIYANEADILNVALFGTTAKEWQEKNCDKKGNMRDHANIFQLICLANLESLNSLFINEKLNQHSRLKKLNEVAISQMNILIKNKTIKKLKKKVMDHV